MENIINPPYKKVVSYRFEVEGIWFEITDLDEDGAYIEECRKNGQEDCHMFGSIEFSKENRGFVLLEENFSEYLDTYIVEGILEYVNTHGLPNG